MSVVTILALIGAMVITDRMGALASPENAGAYLEPTVDECRIRQKVRRKA